MDQYRLCLQVLAKKITNQLGDGRAVTAVLLCLEQMHTSLLGRYSALSLWTLYASEVCIMYACAVQLCHTVSGITGPQTFNQWQP